MSNIYLIGTYMQQYVLFSKLTQNMLFFCRDGIGYGGARLVPPRLTCIRRVRDPSTADRGGKWSRGSEKVRARRKKGKENEKW
jgi:hypothetical protein